MIVLLKIKDNSFNSWMKRGQQLMILTLTKFLRLCNCTNLPKTEKPKIKKIVTYVNASEKENPFVLNSVKELREAYLSLNNQFVPAWRGKN